MTAAAVRDPPEDAPRFSPAETRNIILGLMLALFLASLDQTIVATALSSIAGELGGWERMAWVVSAYLIASTVTTPIYGRLSDLFGRRRVLAVAVLWFMAGALACALAPSMGWLIAARVLQGLGGGGLRSIALAVVGDILPPRERGRYQGYLSTAFATANVIGPVLGGLFAEYLSWRWIFWIDLPLGGLAVALSWVQLRRLPLPDYVAMGGRPRIDWWGAVAILAATTPVLLGITAIQRGGRWDTPEVVGWFAAGLAGFVLLLAVERAAAEPMLPLRLFGGREFSLACAISFVTSMMNLGLVILIPLSYQLLAGLSANGSGLRMIAMTLGTVSGSFAGGQWVSWSGRYRALPILGALVAAAVCWLTAWVGLGHLLLFDSAATLVLGLAFGCSYSPMTVAIQNAVAPRDGGVAVSCLMFFRLLGGAFGVAALSAILLGSLAGGLPELGPNPGVALFQPAARAALAPEAMAALRGTLEAAFAQVFLAAGVAMLLSAGLATMLHGLPLRSR